MVSQIVNVIANKNNFQSKPGVFSAPLTVFRQTPNQGCRIFSLVKNY